MNETAVGKHGHWAGIIGFSLLWIGLAVWRPETTWHLAPGIIATFPNITERPSPGRHVGFIVAIVVSLLLGALNLLRGPSLLPIGGPLLEAVAVAVLGWGTGLFVTANRRSTVNEAP